MIELTQEQQLAVRGTSGEDITVVDRQTGRQYVLIRAEHYECLVFDILQDVLNRTIPLSAETRRRIDDCLRSVLWHA